jgi:preprotein translocase subunit YajC
MSLDSLNAIFAMGPPPQPGQQAPPWWVNLVPLLMMVGVFWFLLIRPQQKKAAEHAKLLQSLRPGDRIVTSSGIVGIVVSVKDKSVSIRSADTKLEILKSAVSEITERSGEAEKN